MVPAAMLRQPLREVVILPTGPGKTAASCRGNVAAEKSMRCPGCALRTGLCAGVENGQPLRTVCDRQEGIFAAGGHRGGETVDCCHRVHLSDERREPLLGHGVGSRKVRGNFEAKDPRSIAHAVGCRVTSLSRWQMGGSVADDALGQQVGQFSVGRDVRIAEDALQLGRFDERRPP